MGGYAYTVVALIFLIPALGVACWWDWMHPDPRSDWEGMAARRGRLAAAETTGSWIGGAVYGVVALVALVVAARDWQEHRGAETALLVAGGALFLGAEWVFTPFQQRMRQRSDLRRAERVQELAAHDPEYARAAAMPNRVVRMTWWRAVLLGFWLAFVLYLRHDSSGRSSMIPVGSVWTPMVILASIGLVGLIWYVTARTMPRGRAAVADPAAAPAADGAIEPVDVESPTSALIDMTAAELESRLGIHFDEQWDGVEFVGVASFSLDGIGRVALVHRGGADAEGVEVHLEDGSTGSTEKLATALGLPPEKLRPA